MAEAYDSRGTIYIEKDEPDKAIADYTKAIKFAKKASAYHNRGVAHAKKGKHDKAIADYTEAIKLDPDYASSFNARGASYFEKGEHDKAIADLTKAITLDGNVEGAYLNRGIVYSMQRMHAKALLDYNRALSINPNNARTCNNLAWSLAVCPNAKLRDGKQAVQLAKKACEQAQWKKALYFGTLAAAYAEAGQFEEAVKWQERALDDVEYKKEHRAEAEMQLKLYKQGKPYREKPKSKQK